MSELTKGPTMREAVECFLAICRAKNLSPNTLSYYAYRLLAFTRYTDTQGASLTPAGVTPQHIRAFLTHELETRSATTAHHSLLTLRVFYGCLVSEGLAQSNPALAVKKPHRSKTVIPTISTDQVEALLCTCGKDFLGVRDRAIILTMLDTGVRVQELADLKIENVALDHQTMLVLGKGAKERLLPFGAGVRAALVSYLGRRRDARAATFFVNHYGDPLSRHSVARMLTYRARVGGITSSRVSPHVIRHTFAKQWLLNGGDALSLQRMLGHSTLDMVRVYVDLVAGEVQAIHRQASPVDRMRPPQRIGRRHKIRGIG